MKKILTFLVMMLVTVSIVSAQQTSDAAAPKTKFNYQAVVRDSQNDNNLVMGKACTVDVQVLQGADVVYTETLTGTTNRNGMISLVIGEHGQGTALDSIDWSISTIEATFKVDGSTVSTVQTAVMAVPYALQAKNAPIKITTEQICNYLKDSKTTRTSVDSIFAALVANTDVNPYLKDTIINYIKTQDAVIRDLVLYFTHKILPSDLQAANDTVLAETKAAVRDLLVQYAKDNKDAALDVFTYYVAHATRHDVDTILKAVKANHEAFDTILVLAKDSIVKYLKANPALVKSILKAWVDAATVQDVEAAHDYVKNTELYNYMYGKFVDYLHYYLTEKFYAVSDSCVKHQATSMPRVDLCELKADVDHLQGLVSDCPAVTVSINATNGTIVAHVMNVSGTEIPNKLTVKYRVNPSAASAGNWQTLSVQTATPSNNGSTLTWNFDFADLETGNILEVNATLTETTGCPQAEDVATYTK